MNEAYRKRKLAEAIEKADHARQARLEAKTLTQKTHADEDLEYWSNRAAFLAGIGQPEGQSP